MPDQTFPDLDLMPDCSICDGPLEYDDGTFHCERCVVSWPRSGEGHEATSERQDAGLCEARMPDGVAPLYEGMFCEEWLGHDGDHVIPAQKAFGSSPQREIRWPQNEGEAEGHADA